MIKVLICDLDGSLMNPSSGLYVKEEVKEKLEIVPVETVDQVMRLVFA